MAHVASPPLTRMDGAPDPRIRQLVEALLPVFADASVGVFSRSVEIPDGEDELTPVYVGVQVMVEMIREALADLEGLNASLERKVADQTAALQRAMVARPLVRRIVREIADGAGVGRRAMHDVGESLARGTDAPDVRRFLEVFDAMGLGRIELHGERGGRFVFEGADLLERREGARMTTCFLAGGFLTGAVSRLHPRAVVLGSEVACQSRGDARCRFVVQTREGTARAPAPSSHPARRPSPG